MLAVLEAAGGDAHDGALESRVGDHQVGAAGEQQQRLAARIGGGNRLDQLGGVRRLEQASRRATELQRGQLGEWDVLALLHEASIPGRRPAAPQPTPPCPAPALLRRPVWRSRIEDPPVSRRCVSAQRVRRDLPVTKEMQHGPPAGQQGIGDQLTMAATGVAFGAHDRGPALPAEFLESLETCLERRLVHVVGVGPKRRIAPGGVVGARFWNCAGVRRRSAPPAAARRADRRTVRS